MMHRLVVSSACRTVLRRATQTNFRPALLNNVAGNMTAVCSSQQQQPLLIVSSPFSTSAAEEKPFRPGVGVGKTSTGYTGLAVEPDWYNVILKKFQALLDTMEASDMPETAQYRIDVTKWCNYVIATTKANPNDPEAVEDAVQMGQVEELIEMAEDEMIALETYLRTRMWELVEDSNPSVDFNPDPMKDPFAEGGDPDVAEKLRKGMEAQKQSGAEKK